MRALKCLFCLALLVGCGSLQPYRVTITQGNLILEKMADQLRLGMTPEQVVHVLGPPMAESPMNPDIWDYIYRVERGGAVLFSYTVQLTFKEGALSTITGLKKFDQQGDAEQTATEAVQAQSDVDLAKIEAKFPGKGEDGDDKNNPEPAAP